MKSTLQIVLAVVVLVVVVISLTFIAHFSWYAAETKDGGTNNKPEGRTGPSVLEIPHRVNLDETEPGAGIFHREYEVKAPYHRDFWLANRHPVEAQVQLQMKSCTCSNAQIAIVPEELWRKTHEESALPSALISCLAGGGTYVDVFLPVALHTLGKELKWQPLAEQGNIVTIPPAASKDQPRLGILRVGWTGETLGPVRLTAALGARQKDTEKWEIYAIETAHTIVAAVRLLPLSADVGTLGYGETKQTELFCWSASRPNFDVDFYERTKDPCIVCEAFPLTAEERARLEERLQGKQTNRPQVSAGYRLRVTVHERKSDQIQMDLGPFQRHLIIKSNLAEEQLTATLSGTVRGEIRILSSEGKDRIDFENFPAGLSKQVKLTLASEAGVELQVDDFTPALLKVKLSEAKASSAANRREWILDVEVPANAASGRFPANSAIVLKTQGATSRKIRIPVSGTAYAR